MKSDRRISDAKKLMDQRGLDILVGFSDGICSMGSADAIWSLTRYRPIDETVVVVPKNDSPTLLVKTSWEANTASKYISEELIVTTSNLVHGLSTTLAKAKTAGTKIGISGLKSLSKVRSDAFSTVIGRDAKHVDDFTSELGKARYADEIELAKKATEIGERGYTRLLEFARPNMKEFELACELSCHMKSLGADDNFQLIASSQHNIAVRQPSDRILEKNDIIIAEISPGVDGVFVQICRSAMIGEVPDIVNQKYDLLVDCFNEGLSMCRPGVKVSELVEVMNNVLGKAGYSEYCRMPYMRARGHGLGLGSRFPGDLQSDNQMPLENGMMFVLHPNQYIPETGYFLCGDAIIVNDDKPIRLAKKNMIVDQINTRR